MAELAGGTFAMGAAERRVTVARFCLDRTEVTVAAYARCVQHGRCTPGDTGETCNTGLAGRGDHPINCVTWAQAESYCGGEGKRLPTEQEWEWAARGGARGSRYPWGADEPGAAVCWNGEGNALGHGNRHGTCPAAASAGDRTPSGVSDLAGNVAEWTATRYGPREQEPPFGRVFRGGNWQSYGPGELQATERSEERWAVIMDRIGFRCAR
ncbi:MAG TPA: SUMF1/EgtB/PvdO family nonheme iron enzyme [Polyangia bacterium]|jgi:formylglycine-generating enzyme required for sulfatase activity